jgi:hypothetical protein
MAQGVGVELSDSARSLDDGHIDDISDRVTNMDIDTMAGYEKVALADDPAMVMEHNI